MRTPQPGAALADVMPEASRQLMDLAAQLETHYHHAQDIEFTIENGRLFILQTRNAKRIPPAAVKIAVDMVAGAPLAGKRRCYRFQRRGGSGSAYVGAFSSTEYRPRLA